MTKDSLISKTIEILEKLPQDKILEVSDFADFILKKFEEQSLRKGIQTLASNSKSFNFLFHEEDLYDEKDIKEKF